VKTAVRNFVRKFFYTSNTARYRVEIPRLREALAKIRRLLVAVDVGAGGGYYAANVYARVADQVIGIEYDNVLFQLLKNETASLGQRVSCRRGSILDLPVETGAADLTATTQVLEHIEDHERAMSELVRITRSGGYLLVTVPNPPAPWPESGHVREGYSINSLRDLATPYSLQLIHHDYFLTRPTQKIIMLANRLRQRLPALLPLRELKQDRETRQNDQPYGLLALFLKP
jgi:SAM-dependent methyltransferase